ncbi:hypothetical protein ACFX15_024496 [Malus domestica]
MPNSQISTKSSLPLDQKVKATVFMTQDYGSDIGWLFQKICINYTTWGYAVFVVDLLNHGRSDGISCYLDDMEKSPLLPSPTSFTSASPNPTSASLPSCSASPWMA